MWEKQSQQAQWKTPGRESRRQRAARAAEDMSALLFVQVMLCLLVCAAALAFKWLNAPFFPQMQAQYGEMLERGVAFSSEHPIVRFAGDALETMQNRMRSALGAFSAAQDAGGGQGGFWPAESESVPDGASTQDYTLASQPVRPAQGAVTSAFGFRENPVNGEDDFHAGIDIAAEAGTQAVSALDGQVCRTARSDVRGNYVVVRHADGVRTLYQHLACAVVREGESVRAGQPVGLVGETGLVTGPHLHFELMVDGVLVDPQKSLPAQTAA